MAIIVDESTRAVVQGITGHHGSFHTGQMLAFGSAIAAGVAPGRAGQSVHGVPVYDTVEAAREAQDINTSVIFVPAAFAKDAAMEAISAGLKTVVVITEHIPVHDAMELMSLAEREGTTVVGPNTFGICSAGTCKLGIVPNQIFSVGGIGLVARSGTLTYEIVASLTADGLGQSTCVGLGGDRVAGLDFVRVLRRFKDDPQTEAVVMVGEIGGTAEEEAAEYIKTEFNKPVVAYIAGKSAPPGKRMGHAGAIIERGRGTFQSKVEALKAAGTAVAELPWEVPGLVRSALAV
ncbi:MAG: succinate--CoA ligase subunit alpha [Firmicutes bacterium]|nr:succinate--CoA ligase subunit alpha [Bacillota bacterium]